jgi:hypothetical protein
VLYEGNLITCVYDSTKKSILIIVLQSLALVVIHFEMICNLTLLGEMRPPVSASTGVVSAVIRRSRRGREEEILGPSLGGKN